MNQLREAAGLISSSAIIGNGILNNGADVNKRMHNGVTPLHGAAAFGHRDIVTLLLKYGADKNAKVRTEQWDEIRPVDTARQEGHKGLIPLLEP